MVKCSTIGCNKKSIYWEMDKKTGTDFFFCKDCKPKTLPKDSRLYSHLFTKVVQAKGI